MNRRGFFGFLSGAPLGIAGAVATAKATSSAAVAAPEPPLIMTDISLSERAALFNALRDNRGAFIVDRSFNEYPSLHELTQKTEYRFLCDGLKAADHTRPYVRLSRDEKL